MADYVTGLQGPVCPLPERLNLLKTECVFVIYLPVSESDTPESRRRMLSDSDSDISDIPPELPPRTPSRTLSNAVGTTSVNGETRSSRTVSVVSTDNNLTAFINDPWTNGIHCYHFI